MSEQLARFDVWLKDNGPAAIVLREVLIPVEGDDGVIFPPTFAGGDGFKGGYNIDEFPDGSNVCIVDTVGSQANRVEPLFATDEFKNLTPQIVIEAGEKRVNLLEAGHRAGDAIVRCTELRQRLQSAFKALLMGDALPLAKLAPTSLVFGVWDSRDTQAKAPRLVASTIRAFNVRRLTRSAQYVPAVDYIEGNLLEEPDDLKTEDGRIKTKHPFAQRGFTHVPATGTHGGVIASGGIRRDATFHLAALRMWRAKNGANATIDLQRYLLGLSLIALVYQPSSYLRQGCNLVRKPETPREIQLVYPDGRREAFDFDLAQAIQFASDAAKKFGVERPEKETLKFDPEKAKADLVESGDTAKRGRGKPKK